MNAALKGQLIGYGVAIGVGLVAFMYLKNKAGDAAAAVGNSVNPVSDKNLAYRASNAVGSVLTDSKPGAFSVGSWFYDFFNPGVDDHVTKSPNSSGAGGRQEGYTNNDYATWVKNQSKRISE